MYQIAVVDDENVFQEQIREYIKKYQEENEMEIQAVFFDDLPLRYFCPLTTH